MDISASKHLPEHLVKMSVLQILQALDYLHTEADLIHTGNNAEKKPYPIILLFFSSWWLLQAHYNDTE